MGKNPPEPPPTAAVAVDDVLGMMARVPGARWDRQKGAPSVATAVSAIAPSRPWAARMVVYAVLESGLRLSPCAAGDGGKSLGPWQLAGVSQEVACDPMRAARVWLAKAQKSIDDCARLPEDERMAELASGSCDKGRKLARHREVLVLGALGA